MTVPPIGEGAVTRADDAPTSSPSESSGTTQALRYAQDLAALQQSARPLGRRRAALESKDPPKLLIADDDASLRMLVSATLGSESYEVLEAETGLEAWAIVRAERPRLALLDVDMPGMNGLEVCKLIRADPALRTVRVVMLTSASQPADREAGLAAGVDSYLTKPFRPLELLRVIEEGIRDESAGGHA